MADEEKQTRILVAVNTDLSNDGRASVMRAFEYLMGNIICSDPPNFKLLFHLVVKPGEEVSYVGMDRVYSFVEDFDGVEDTGVVPILKYIIDRCLNIGLDCEAIAIIKDFEESINLEVAALTPDFLIIPLLGVFYSTDPTSSTRSSLSPGDSYSHFDSQFVVVGDKPLGKGGFGKVVLCRNLVDEATYAIKMIPFADQEHDLAMREPILMAKIQHPNVVRYHQAWIENKATPLSSSDGAGFDEEDELATQSPTSTPSKTLYICMEYCPSTLIAKIKSGLERGEIYHLVLQMLEGLKSIHDQGIIHRDISRQNILIDSAGNIKITDFGLAVAIEGVEGSTLELSHEFGNAIYRAPEMRGEKPVASTKSDIFSLGLVIYEMIFPMSTDSERDAIFRELREGTFSWTGVDMAHLLMWFLDPQPSNRLTTRDILIEGRDSGFWNYQE